MINVGKNVINNRVFINRVRNLCIHADTYLPTDKFGSSQKVKDLYEKSINGVELGKIWSYNISKHKYELVDFTIKKNPEQKKMLSIVLEDETVLKCTEDQKILNNATKKYIKAKRMKSKMTTPFLRQLCLPSWCVCSNVRNESILVLESQNNNEKSDAYKIVVNNNKNYAVITDLVKNVECGIILADSD